MLKYRTTLFTIILSLNLSGQTIITESEVTGDWLVTESPFIIEGNITIPADERLNIEPGVQILFAGPYDFVIEGRLNATGTAQNKIIFSVQDSTGWSAGHPNGWYGLGFMGYSSVQPEESVLSYCIIEYSQGSGIACLLYSHLIIDNCLVQKNKGVGINVLDNSDIIIQGTIITENNLGGLSVNYSAPKVSDFSIVQNSGTGLILNGNSVSGEKAVFSNGKIKNNQSAVIGGGVRIIFDSSAEFEDVEVCDNFSETGGGIYCSMAYATLRNCLISNNYAQTGGGIFCEESAEFNLFSSIVANNQAEQVGGAFRIASSNFVLDHVTVTYNTANIAGGGLSLYNDNSWYSRVSNSIFWNNYPEEIVVEQNSPVIEYSDVAGGFPGTGNIDQDPLFAAPLNMNFDLTWENFPYEDQTKSPCIDNGNPFGGTDPDGTSADMGAKYYEQNYMTGIFPGIELPQISFFPNPVKDYLTIQSPNIVERLIISQSNGSIMKNVIINARTHTIDLSSLGNGFYLMRLNLENGAVITEKFLKH
jgi:hypothetical protein